MIFSSNSLTSTSLNQADYKYFQENFKVIDTNVSCLEEANTILLGETHDHLEHRIKNCWLLNKITHDNDTVYLECCKFEPISKKIFEVAYKFPIYPEVKFKSWDDQEILDHYASDLYPEFNKIVERLKKIVDKYKNDLLSDEKKIKAICTINNLIPKDLVLKQTCLNSVDSKNIPDCAFFPLAIDVINKCEYLSKTKRSSKELNDLLVVAIKDIAFILEAWRGIEILGKNFFKRQESLSKNIQEENGKFFGIAGRDHLRLKKNEEGLLEIKEGFEKLMQVVKKKKFVILFPTDAKNTEYPADYFNETKKSEREFGKIRAVLHLAKCLFITVIISAILGITSKEYDKYNAIIGFAIFAIQILLLVKQENADNKNTQKFIEKFKVEDFDENVEFILNLYKEFLEESKSIPNELFHEIVSTKMELVNIAKKESEKEETLGEQENIQELKRITY